MTGDATTLKSFVNWVDPHSGQLGLVDEEGTKISTCREQLLHSYS
jgi:hypothetical protein